MSLPYPHPGSQSLGISPWQRLTLRERQVANYITAGRSNKVIAAELGLSYRTVEAHRARIFNKVGVRNAVELTQRCMRWHQKVPIKEDGLSGGWAGLGRLRR
ncbi:helix-turn-helix transcriptional regulator [Castellaniella sp.]|uniref:response regulator transcription factor n=1 Tax=Castellaniella sp. TaxID=1955812 RepID=UPI002AFFC906|nr:helix-turn-helix transcriptional regulator [Castellaniella sp.]